MTLPRRFVWYSLARRAQSWAESKRWERHTSVRQTLHSNLFIAVSLVRQPSTGHLAAFCDLWAKSSGLQSPEEECLCQAWSAVSPNKISTVKAQRGQLITTRSPEPTKGQVCASGRKWSRQCCVDETGRTHRFLTQRTRERQKIALAAVSDAAATSDVGKLSHVTLG